jgi:hypothetical protein
VQLPASQQTPPTQLGAPVHVTLQSVPPQPTRAQEFMPEHAMSVNFAALTTSAAQARAPEHSTEQELPPQLMGCVHVSGVRH